MYISVRVLDPGVADSCDRPYGCWELNPGPLEEQSMLLTTVHLSSSEFHPRVMPQLSHRVWWLLCSVPVEVREQLAGISSLSTMWSQPDHKCCSSFKPPGLLACILQFSMTSSFRHRTVLQPGWSGTHNPASGS